MNELKMKCKEREGGKARLVVKNLYTERKDSK